jgi:ubiquinone/menaquinone biosynthesis C-methylase UbiE
MFLEKILANQLAHPKGILSNPSAMFMNRVTSQINDMTIQMLDIKPIDRVLDIGFGGGSAMKKITKLAPDGLVAGIDISEAMLRRGNKKFSKLLSLDKVSLKEGNASKIPYENDFFDKVYTVNTIYFWSDPVDDSVEVYRVMKEGGKFIITYFTKEMFHFTRYGFTLHPEQYLCDSLQKAGFIDIHVNYREHPRFATAFIVATKPK